MSLIACRECGKEVSGEALSCPHCGCLQPKESAHTAFEIACWLGVIGLILGTILTMMANAK